MTSTQVNTSAIIHGFEVLANSGQFNQLIELYAGESGGCDWRNLSPSIIILITVHLAPHLPELREICGNYWLDRQEAGLADPEHDYKWQRAKLLLEEWGFRSVSREIEHLRDDGETL